jgi:S-DNA-T family DNA segregation ATPase FtsK/SpoIIIE
MSSIKRALNERGYLSHTEPPRDPRYPPRVVNDVEFIEPALETRGDVRYGLRCSAYVLRHVRGMEAEFAHALNVRTVSIAQDGAVVWVIVPKADAEVQLLTFDDAWKMSPLKPGQLLLGAGQNAEGTWQFTIDVERTSHWGIYGSTGSGKSVAMRTMIHSAQRIGGVHVALLSAAVDSEGGFGLLAGHPTVIGHKQAEGAYSCYALLNYLVIKRAEFARPVYVFIDEVHALTDAEPDAARLLGVLASSGRHAHFHLFAGTQHPRAIVLGSDTIANLSGRIVGRVSNKNTAYVATGIRDSGAETLRGRGDMLVVAGGQIERFQAAYLSPDDLDAIAKRWPPAPPLRMARKPRQAPAPTLPAQRATGRAADTIPDEMVDWARGVVAETGAPPSISAVRKRAKELYGAEYRHDKARRVVDAVASGA